MDEVREVSEVSVIGKIEYRCDKCNKKVFLGPKDPIKCPYCDYRIVKKVRTKRIVQYLAR